MTLTSAPGDAEAATDRHTPDLTRSFIHSLAWTGALKWLGQILSWASTLVLARPLSPSDYGIAGMAMLFREFMQLVTEFGVGSAVVAMRELTDDVIAQLNTVAL